MRTLLRRVLPLLRRRTWRPADGKTSGPGWLPAELRSGVARQIHELRAQLGDGAALLGDCPVCGEATVFVGDLSIARESMVCAVCLTTSRYRSLALGILRTIESLTGVNAPSLAALAGQRLPRRIRVFDTQLPFYGARDAYPLPDLLAACPDIEMQVSRFRPHDPLGAPVDVRPFASNQDLEHLTFADGAFDLVITSDVMEHVRRDDLAHAQIRRVLAPGGVYLFTVPHTRGQRDTIHRVKLHDPADPSRDEYVLPKEYHGDANQRRHASLSYRVYGTELDETLQRLGFAVDYSRQDHARAGILNTELFFCTIPRA